MARATSAWRLPISVGIGADGFHEDARREQIALRVEDIAAARVAGGSRARCSAALARSSSCRRTCRSTSRKASTANAPPSSDPSSSSRRYCNCFAHFENHQPPMAVGSSADASRAVVKNKTASRSDSRTSSAFGFSSLLPKICQPPAAIGSSPTASRAAAKNHSGPRCVLLAPKLSRPGDGVPAGLRQPTTPASACGSTSPRFNSVNASAQLRGDRSIASWSRSFLFWSCNFASSCFRVVDLPPQIGNQAFLPDIAHPRRRRRARTATTP